MNGQDIYWRIIVPGTDWTIYEGMVDPIDAKFFIAFTVVGILWLGMFAWHRVENWIHSDRSKSRED